jgi:hypothetical protein
MFLILSATPRTYYVYFTNCNGTAVARTDSTAISTMTNVTPSSH